MKWKFCLFCFELSIRVTSPHIKFPYNPTASGKDLSHGEVTFRWSGDFLTFFRKGNKRQTNRACLDCFCPEETVKWTLDRESRLTELDAFIRQLIPPCTKTAPGIVILWFILALATDCSFICLLCTNVQTVMLWGKKISGLSHALETFR